MDMSKKHWHNDMKIIFDVIKYKHNATIAKEICANTFTQC